MGSNIEKGNTSWPSEFFPGMEGSLNWKLINVDQQTKIDNLKRCRKGI